MKILIPLVGLLIILQSCDLFLSPDKSENIEVQLKNINSSDGFSKININGASELYLTKGPKHKISLVGNEKHFKYIRAEVKGNTLICNTENNVPFHLDVEIHVTMPHVSLIRLSGAGEIEMNSFGQLKDLELELAGAGEFDTKGAPTRVENLDIAISGAGDVDAEDLIANHIKISVAGAGSAELYAKKSLDARVSGVGSITYKGNPKVKKQITGIGSISKD